MKEKKESPIAFCDGQKDYVTTWENGEMEMQERMAQALLLDKLDADWKSDYDFSVPMIELIYENLGL